jgi:hypothetical protein
VARRRRGRTTRSRSANSAGDEYLSSTSSRRSSRARKPINVPIPRACCQGWFFEHTSECPTPHIPRPCSDCAAEPGAKHNPGCQWRWE